MVLEDLPSTASPASSECSQLDSSTDRCTSPETSSSDMSVSSSPNSDAVKRPQVGKDQSAKKARTSYTREQTLALMKIFQENPYPDHEKLENIGNELGIPENKLKIWFQNRRARTRRKDNFSSLYQQPIGSSPVTPAVSYGYLPPTNMLSSLPSVNPGYFTGYPWMPNVTNPNSNYPMFSHYNRSRLQPTGHTVPIVTGGYHTGYSHPGNASPSQQSQNNAVLSWTPEKHAGNANLFVSQQYTNMDSQFRNTTFPLYQREPAQLGTSSLLMTQQKDAGSALSILPATSNYGISQSLIYSGPYHSISANNKNSVHKNLC